MISNLAVAVLNAVVWGMIMALIALGLNMIFGLLHIINMAHGALYMLGAVMAWYLIEVTGKFLDCFGRRSPLCRYCRHRHGKGSTQED